MTQSWWKVLAHVHCTSPAPTSQWSWQGPKFNIEAQHSRLLLAQHLFPWPTCAGSSGSRRTHSDIPAVRDADEGVRTFNFVWHGQVINHLSLFACKKESGKISKKLPLTCSWGSRKSPSSHYRSDLLLATPQEETSDATNNKPKYNKKTRM